MSDYPASESIKRDILAAGFDITCWRPDRFYCYDPEFDRRMRVLRQAPTAKQLKRLIEIEPGCDDCPDRDDMARVLAERYPAMCAMVKHVFVVGSYDGLLKLLDKYKMDEDLLPDIVLGEEPFTLSDSYVGVFWHYESTVIVNYAAIEHVAYDGLCMEPERETAIGVWSTLLHELRHMAVDCPIDCLRAGDTPQDLTEDGVEAWCREQTDALIDEGIV